jgi:hypothetical protein
MKRVIIVLAALLLTLVLAAPAAAVKPVTYPMEPEDFEVLVDPGWGWFDCGFDVMYGSTGTPTYQEWQDEDGNPVKGLYRKSGVDYFYPVSDPDNVVGGKYSLTSHLYDFVFNVTEGVWEWDERVTGNRWGIEMPAAGNVYHEAGQMWQHATGGPDQEDWIYEVSRIVGNVVFDADELCTLLAPQP